MTKRWNTLSWILILVAQYATGYALAYMSNLIINQPEVSTMKQFLLFPLGIWLSYIIGVHGVGMFGLFLKKMKPMIPGLRFLTTAIMAVIPMLILIFNAVTVGVDNNLQQFHDLVMIRRVPYYTQLCAVFALLGFYATVWWHKAVPTKKKA